MSRLLTMIAVLLALLACDRSFSDKPPSAEDLRRARHDMISEQLQSRDITEPRVLEAMRTVPRHLFVPRSLQANAYEDRPLPIGHRQTISQPYIVALMTQLAAVGEGDRVLEVGTGSGYQAAILAAMGVHVWTIEIVEPPVRGGALLSRAVPFPTAPSAASTTASQLARTRAPSHAGLSAGLFLLLVGLVVPRGCLSARGDVYLFALLGTSDSSASSESDTAS